MALVQLGVRSGTLKVPGAQLYYEAQGLGPVLLMIPGGPADAGIFAPLAALLAGRYTVVRYDPRGNSRSTLDGPPRMQNMDEHGDDAALLLAVFGSAPAFVLGSSGGAQIGLNLAARHPERVAALVAHEPPCMGLLPPDAEVSAFVKEVGEIYKSQGAGPAMRRFAVGAGLGGQRPADAVPPAAEITEAMARMQANLDYFFSCGFQPLGQFVPDVKTLRAGEPCILVGVGENSARQLPARAATALAGQLGVESVAFPGGHAGYNEYPNAFAEKLRSVLHGAA